MGDQSTGGVSAEKADRISAIGNCELSVWLVHGISDFSAFVQSQ
jgi:hypothetical protein